MNVIIVLVVLLCTLVAFVYSEDSSFFICEAGDENLIGEYRIESESKDGVSVYSNANDLSIFRNNGFWYIGNLGPWPPETFYRCVEPEECNAEENLPPVPGKWSASKKFGKEPVPVISATPCAVSEEL